MKAAGSILLILGVVLIVFGVLTLATTSSYRMSDHITNIVALISCGGFSLIVGSILFGCGSIVDAIKGNETKLSLKGKDEKSDKTNHEKIKDILKR
ncbi:hypothetical protein [Moellerella wisconsensis]|uniref:hypothetical protein n=1 Tax=Moellerella wisconsensis TaxID=158849 RepID=UPI003075FE3D